jgi:hypothetical protein
VPLTDPDLQADLDYLVARIARGPGLTPAQERAAAIDGHVEVQPDHAMAAYLAKVRDLPTAVTDDVVAALREAGHSDDTIFELTVATALGAAKRRLDAGLAAVVAAAAAAEDR